MKAALATSGAPQAIGPYSQAIKAGDWVFVSGQLPLDPAGGAMPAGAAEQTERCLRNVAAILGQFAAMNEVYAKHFPAPCPARATVQVAALPKGAAVEIEAVAFAGTK